MTINLMGDCCDKNIMYMIDCICIDLYSKDHQSVTTNWPLIFQRDLNKDMNRSQEP